MRPVCRGSTRLACRRWLELPGSFIHLLAVTASAERVLIVDDDRADLKAISSIIREVRHPVQIETLTSGRELLEFFEYVSAQHQLPDLILLDVHMPSLDGVETLRRMRDIPARPWVPIVIVTASHHQSDILACYQAGANAVIQKPGNLAELRRTLKSVLDFWLSVATPPLRPTVMPPPPPAAQ